MPTRSRSSRANADIGYVFGVMQQSQGMLPFHARCRWLVPLAVHGHGNAFRRDSRGSVTAMLTPNRTLARAYSYDPWGTTVGGSSTTYNPFQFTGTSNDGNGLYLMGQCYFQLASGRFTQLDPKPCVLYTRKRYAYAGGNPANFTDPVVSHAIRSALFKRCLLDKFIFSCGVGIARCVATSPGWLVASMRAPARKYSIARSLARL